MGKLLTQLGAITMTWTSISGLLAFISICGKFVFIRLFWGGYLNLTLPFDYMFSGHPIASLLAGQCVMMVIFSNQLVIWHRYSYLLSYYPTFPQFPLFFTLSYDSGIREERGFLKENLEARGNHILLKAEPIGTSLEVLIDYGHFMFSFYRYEISNLQQNGTITGL